MLFLSYLAWLFLTLFGINSEKDNKKVIKNHQAYSYILC